MEFRRVIRLLMAGSTVVVALAQGPPNSLPLHEDCSRLSPILAYVQPSDSLRVRYGLAGAEMDCYAVTVRIGDRSFQGHLVGVTHPAIIEFKRDIRSHVPPTFEESKPPVPGAGAPANPPPPQSFAGLNYLDVKGRRVDLAAMKAPVVVLYFWSTRDPKSLRDTELLEYVYEQYHRRGVELVGVASAPDAESVRRIAGQREALWPQILDSGTIAKKYQVAPEKPYYILDRTRNVINSLSSATEIDAELQSRLNGRQEIR